MLSFLAFLIGAVVFALVGHHNLVAQDEVWGFFAVAVGLALEYVPVIGGYVKRYQK